MMQEAVSSILIGRSHQADGLNRMVLVSLVVHGVLLTTLVLVPRDWLRTNLKQQAAPMMISLGPSGTADTGGNTAITTAPVQTESPTEAKPVVRPAEKDTGDDRAGAGRQAEAGTKARRRNRSRSRRRRSRRPDQRSRVARRES